MLSVVEVCADYGGVNVFHVLILVSSMVLGFVSSLWCSLLCCNVVGVWLVVVFVFICDVCSWRCSFMGIVCVSSCRYCVFVSVVHQVAILSAGYCVICSLLMFVSDASGDHIYMVDTYSSMGLVMALYVAMIVSFCFPHVVDVSDLSIWIVLRTFVVVISMCLVYVSLGSRVSPSIFGFMFMGSVMLSICSSSCVLYSCWVLCKESACCLVWVEDDVVCPSLCMHFM